MIREWKLFKGGPSLPRRDRLYVTLNTRGMILINHKLFDEMGRPEAALLLYDERNQTIGVQPARPGEQYSFPLKIRGNASHRSIYAWPFCKLFKLRPEKTVRFTDPKLDDDGILLLDLHNSHQV